MVQDIFAKLHTKNLSPLDFLPQENIEERVISLVIEGVPSNFKGEVGLQLHELSELLHESNFAEVNVVVFGGGTGLANLIGGGSRKSGWGADPFTGLKEIFPKVQSVVCITDDGGSTGELLKSLPLIALGDIRHVLLSSVQRKKLQERYKLVEQQAVAVTGILADLFNARLAIKRDGAILQLQELVPIKNLPEELEAYLERLYTNLLGDERLSLVLEQEHCLGNLFLVSAIYQYLDGNLDLVNETAGKMIHHAIDKGLRELGSFIGCAENGVMPCSSTPAQLRTLYTNGVEIIGESKMSRSSRGYPVELVKVDFTRAPVVYDSVIKSIEKADLIIFAPGSLYSSIIPILKIPEIVEAVRKNSAALKLMIANLWVQTGETDLSIPDPTRKFFVSDMIKAYEQNIPGGTEGLFDRLLCLRLNDIPASIVQRYALENKVPIYLDRDEVQKLGYLPIECGVYSKEALEQRGVIQHDAKMLAAAIKAVYCSVKFLHPGDILTRGEKTETYFTERENGYCPLPCLRYEQICTSIDKLDIKCEQPEPISDLLIELLWANRDIPLNHLDFVAGIKCIKVDCWKRSQKWDNVFSFYDPEDRFIKIREDLVREKEQFSVGFLVALGESLLGGYAQKKEMEDILLNGSRIGRIYHLFLKDINESECFFSQEELDDWLKLTRMNSFQNDKTHYLRVLNKDEGFTPPGLFLGLLYAWYIDNRLASHIEYKMNVMKIRETGLVHEQKKISRRRQKMIKFMREIVFNPKRNK